MGVPACTFSLCQSPQTRAELSGPSLLLFVTLLHVRWKDCIFPVGPPWERVDLYESKGEIWWGGGESWVCSPRINESRVAKRDGLAPPDCGDEAK